MRFAIVVVDQENPADRWWGELRDRHPVLADVLSRFGIAIISDELYDAVTRWPGFNDGPYYARHPVLRIGFEELPNHIGSGDSIPVLY